VGKLILLAMTGHEETHKGRARWLRWSGTPTRVAEIAAKAGSFFDGTRLPVQINVDSPAWESHFTSPGAFVERIGSDDLADITKINIEAGTERKRIAVSLERSVGQNQQNIPVVRLNVAGPERVWVDEALASMREEIERGVPSQRGPRAAAAISLVSLGVGGIFAGVGAHGSPTKAVGYAFLAVGGALFLLLAVASALFFPSFELLPDGAEPRRTILSRWGRREGSWLVRIIVGGLIGSAITLAIQRL
jgi:hypothetical protein